MVRLFMTIGDEVTSVMVRGRELRVRKRAPALESPYTQFVKKIRHAKSEVPKFDPFKKVEVDQLQAFQRWFEGDANGNTTIRYGLAFQRKQIFDIMYSPQHYINSEVSVIFRIYLIRYSELLFVLVT